MPRIPYPDPNSLPEIDRNFLESLPQLNISRLLAGSPSLFQPLTRVFSAYLNDGCLSPELRELIILRTGYLLNSEYEIYNHKRVARVIGMDEERIEALLTHDPADLFSERERLIVQFVDEVIGTGSASEPTFRAVEQVLQTDELIELSVVIGIYTMVSQVCATFEIEPEEAPIAASGLKDISMAVQGIEKI